jgi:hypothetical protein
LHMPAYKGKVIRADAGSTFRQIVCHGNCREPETCELRNVCPYAAMFHLFVARLKRLSIRGVGHEVR